MAADGGVHDVDPHPLAEVDRLEAELQPVLGRQVGMAAEAEGDQAEPVHHALDAAERLGVAVERNVLGPAAHGAELDEFVASLGDVFERLFDGIRVVERALSRWPQLVGCTLAL